MSSAISTASAVRLSLSRKANNIACSYLEGHTDNPESCHVRITVIPRRGWFARMILGNPYSVIH